MALLRSFGQRVLVAISTILPSIPISAQEAELILPEPNGSFNIQDISPNLDRYAALLGDRSLHIGGIIEPRTVLRISNINVSSVTFFPRSPMIAFTARAGGNTTKPYRLYVYDISKQANVIDFDCDSSFVTYASPLGRSIAVSPDESTIAAVWRSGTESAFGIWNTKSGMKISGGRLSSTFSFAHLKFSTSSRQLAICTDRLRLIDVPTGRILKTFNSQNPVVAFSKDGKQMAYLKSGVPVMEIAIDEIPSLRNMKTLTLPVGSFNQMTFSPDGRNIIGADYSKNVFIWDIETNQESHRISGLDVGTWEYITSLVVDSDYNVLAASISNKIYFWDIKTFDQVAILSCIDTTDWIAIDGRGLFDGSKGGMQRAHYLQNLQALPIEAFFEDYYTPGLLRSVLFSTGKSRRSGQHRDRVFRLPPIVSMDSPWRNKSVSKSTLEVKISITDQGGGIDEYRIYNNGKLVYEEEIGNTSQSNSVVRNDIEIQLVSGVNSIKAIALNEDRIESAPAELMIECLEKDEAPRLFILAVGINKYKNRSYSLRYCVDDARSFVEAIVDGAETIYPEIQPISLLDADATLERIEAAFLEVVRESRPADTFVFYFAGHGTNSGIGVEENPDFYLIPFDVIKLIDTDQVRRRGISSKLLHSWFRKIRAQHQLIIVDACQSGEILQSFASVRGATEEKALMRLSRSAGVAILASALSDQTAKEFEELRHGVFTYVILEGLKGKADNGDEVIMVGELKSFLDSEVPELTSSLRGSPQYPTGVSFGQDFPLTVISKRIRD